MTGEIWAHVSGGYESKLVKKIMEKNRAPDDLHDRMRQELAFCFLWALFDLLWGHG